MTKPDTIAAVARYHEQTKHHYDRYAKSAGFMDWENQPVPFRVYDDAPVFKLPFLESDPPVSHMGMYRRQVADPAPLTAETLGGFMELSLGLSAWKSYRGHRWALRMNPSSGNLHPTEAYLVVPPTENPTAGVFHYAPLHHALEQRCRIPEPLWESVLEHFGCRGFMVGLSSIFWRESWKYGERAFRYCNHDAGHAVAALSVSAALQGWRLVCLNGLADEDVVKILGFDRTAWHPLENEHPDLLCFVATDTCRNIPLSLPENLIAAFAKLALVGTPNRLSERRVDWQVIYRAAADTHKPRTSGAQYDFGRRPFLEPAQPGLTAPAIIRQRRSATAFDPDAPIEKSRLISILDKTLPRNGSPPFDMQLGPTAVHLALFIHNVEDLPRGIYFFFRSQSDMDALKAALKANFLWQPVDERLPLFLLETGDFRHEAIQISCHQDIAGFSAFSLGMLAKFEPTLQQAPYRYRHLFWEAGMIGQVLYLEAEAAGIRGTGIGCYFDDPMHRLLGIADRAWQSLYHFTIGHPVEDPRLTTLPAYHHLKQG
jgi:SagB-type dehydrogenase family enzyme